MVKVVGAGFGRTGTVSLKLALERILGGPCFHMTELMQRREDAALWAGAARGEPVDWQTLLSGWVATVDWPGCAVYDQLAEAFPDAKVLLSSRDPGSWWESADRTIFASIRALDAEHPHRSHLLALFQRSGIEVDNRDASIAAFIAHNESVRAAFGPDRLIEWRPGDGWGPLCAGLGVDEPSVAFPHANSSGGYEEMMTRARAGEPPRYAAPLPDDD